MKSQFLLQLFHLLILTSLTLSAPLPSHHLLSECSQYASCCPYPSSISYPLTHPPNPPDPISLSANDLSEIRKFQEILIKLGTTSLPADAPLQDLDSEAQSYIKAAEEAGVETGSHASTIETPRSGQKIFAYRYTRTVLFRDETDLLLVGLVGVFLSAILVMEYIDGGGVDGLMMDQSLRVLVGANGQIANREHEELGHGVNEPLPRHEAREGLGP